MQAVSNNISRFQNTRNSSGAKPLMSHTFSVKSLLDHRTNASLIALIFSEEVYFTKQSINIQCFSFFRRSLFYKTLSVHSASVFITNWLTYAIKEKNVNKYPPIVNTIAAQRMDTKPSTCSPLSYLGVPATRTVLQRVFVDRCFVQSYETISGSIFGNI